MIDEIRTAAMPRTPPVRSGAATELAGFGSALGTAIGLRSASAEASPDASPPIDRQAQSQQMEKTIKARRMFDKRGSGPMAAASPPVPNRPPETTGNRSGNATQASERPAQQRAAADEARHVQRDSRRADPSAASAAHDETFGSAARAELSDTAPEEKPREKSVASQEAPPIAPVPGLQAQTPQTVPATAAQPLQDATLGATMSAGAASQDLPGATIGVGTAPQGMPGIPDQALHLPEPALGDRLSAQNRLSAQGHLTAATSALVSQTGELTQASRTQAQALSLTPKADAAAPAAPTLEARGGADGQAASPLRLAIARSEAPDMIGMAAAQAAPPSGDETRARPDSKHTPRESLAQPAIVEWRPQPGVTEAALSSQGGDGQRALPDSKHMPRESLAQPAIVEWRPQSVATEAALSSAGSDGQSARRLLDAINGMRQATAAAPPGEPGGSSFAASLASAAASAPSPQPADAAAIPLANPWPLQDPEFQSHLAGQVGEALLAGLERAEITVSPRELGPIKIELALSGENASVAFSAAHPDTREAIERSLPTLETMLAEHGLTLSHSSVSDGAQQSAGRQPGRESQAPAAPITAERSGSRLPLSSDSPRPAPAARGLLDLFA